MLKRNQVLINDWLVKIIKKMSEKYDLSFSEVIRIMLCLQLGKMISYAYPHFDFEYVMIETESIIERKNRGTPLTMEELHTAISRLYFESRKAAEYWHEQEKKVSEKKSRRPALRLSRPVFREK